MPILFGDDSLDCPPDAINKLGWEVNINQFVPNAPSLYSLKTSENCKVLKCFQGVDEGCIGNEWVKSIQ